MALLASHSSARVRSSALNTDDSLRSLSVPPNPALVGFCVDLLDRLGAEVWRTGRVPVGRLEKTIRLELSVVTTPRREGPKPQLVRVRAKDSNRGAGRQERRSS